MRCPYQPYLPPGCLAQVLRQWGLHARVDQIEEGKVDSTCDSWNDAKLLGWRIFCPSWDYISRYHRYPDYFGTIVSIMHRYDHGVIYLDTIVTPSILEPLYPLLYRCDGIANPRLHEVEKYVAELIEKHRKPK